MQVLEGSNEITLGKKKNNIVAKQNKTKKTGYVEPYEIAISESQNDWTLAKWNGSTCGSDVNCYCC